jgi:hypothetical protein
MYTLRKNLEEELALVENYIEFLDARKTGGILFVPYGLTPSEEEVFPGSEESLEEVILETMIAAVQDPHSPASVVPIIIRGEEEWRDQIGHVALDSGFYSSLCARAYRLKAQIKELDNRENSMV